MDSVLIVSSQEKSRQVFEELLATQSYREIVSAGDAGEASRLLLEREFDLCVVNTPLRDEFGTDFAARQSGLEAMQVLLFVKSELAEEVEAKMEDYGVFVLAKPLNRQLLWSALKLMAAAQNRLRGMQDRNLRLQQKLEDIRLVDRAKCTLIAYLKLSEPQAHKYIEKQAMDLRLTRREVAESILKTYEG